MRFLEQENGFFLERLFATGRGRVLLRSCPALCLPMKGQLFFLTILRFRTMSLRESKLETVRVTDFSLSFSACSS